MATERVARFEIPKSAPLSLTLAISEHLWREIPRRKLVRLLRAPAGLAHAAFAMSKVMGSWSQTIRDKEFLVEMRLRNLDSELEREKRAEQQVEVKGDVPAEADE